MNLLTTVFVLAAVLNAASNTATTPNVSASAKDSKVKAGAIIDGAFIHVDIRIPLSAKRLQKLVGHAKQAGTAPVSATARATAPDQQRGAEKQTSHPGDKAYIDPQQHSYVHNTSPHQVQPNSAASKVKGGMTTAANASPGKDGHLKTAQPHAGSQAPLQVTKYQQRQEPQRRSPKQPQKQSQQQSQKQSQKQSKQAPKQTAQQKPKQQSSPAVEHNGAKPSQAQQNGAKSKVAPKQVQPSKNAQPQASVQPQANAQSQANAQPQANVQPQANAASQQAGPAKDAATVTKPKAPAPTPIDQIKSINDVKHVRDIKPLLKTNGQFDMWELETATLLRLDAASRALPEFKPRIDGWNRELQVRKIAHAKAKASPQSSPAETAKKAQEKAKADEQVAKKAAFDKAVAEGIVAAKKAEAEKAQAEKAAIEKAVAERLAIEKAAKEAVAKQQAAQKPLIDSRAADRAAQAQHRAEKEAAEKIVQQKALEQAQKELLSRFPKSR